jgi:hypothetical protein
MRNFRDADPPHEFLNGVIKMRFKQADEKSMKLKEAWDRYLQPVDSKREHWKDGEVKYNVARHHFTETMIQEYLQNKKTWDWTALIAQDDADFWLFELSAEDSLPISDSEMGYLKVPNASKQHVKSFAHNWVLENPSEDNNMDGQGSDSNLSVLSSKSACKSPKVGSRKQKDKVKKVADGPSSLEGLLADLPSASEHSVTKKSPKQGESARKKSSSTAGDEKSSTSRSRKKTTSDDTSVKSSKSRKKSPKRTKDKKEEPEENLEGKILSIPSNDEEEENVAVTTANEEIKKLKQDLFEEQSKAESALEDLSESKKETEALKKEIRELTEARLKDREVRNSVSSAQSTRNVDDATALQSEMDALKEQNVKLQNLSSKRFEMVSEMETKFKGEIDAGKAREQELKTQLSSQLRKIEAAEKETNKTKAELSSVQKEMEELVESHTSETEDFINGVDNLKKRIMSLEEEHSNLLADIDAGKNKSRKLETAKASEQSKIAEMETEIDQLKERNRKLTVMGTVMGTPSAPETDLKQAIETLQHEKDALAAEKEMLSKLNQNQKKVIRSLEGAVDKDNEEVRRISQREDDLERGAALLANIYFTQKNMGDLAEQSTGEESHAGDQALLLKEVMERKQKKWWGSLDGIFAYSNYAEDDMMKEMKQSIE